METSQSQKPIFWHHVAKDGLILGGVFALSVILTHVGREGNSFGLIGTIIGFIGYFVVPFILGRRFAQDSALLGLSFRRAYSYVILIYILSGFILGVVTYFVINSDVEFYIDAHAKTSEILGLTNDADRSFDSLVSSPLNLAFSYMFVMPMLSWIPSLIIALFIKRAPAIR